MMQPFTVHPGLVALAGLAMSVVAAAETSLDTLRLFAVQPDYFEYTFTSVVSSSSNNAVLAFNSAKGSTVFAELGGKVGAYKIKAFEPSIERVFNQSLNQWQEREMHTVILEGPDGRELTLEQNKRLKLPGLVGHIICLETAKRWALREKDVLRLGAQSFPVMSVREDSISVEAGATWRRINKITQAEREAMVAALTNRQAVATAAPAQAKPAASTVPTSAPPTATQPLAPPARTADQPQPVFQPTVQRFQVTDMFVGLDHPYPSDYYAVPPMWDASGKLIRPMVIVPRRFERRSSGVHMRAK